MKDHRPRMIKQKEYLSFIHIPQAMEVPLQRTIVAIRCLKEAPEQQTLSKYLGM